MDPFLAPNVSANEQPKKKKKLHPLPEIVQSDLVLHKAIEELSPFIQSPTILSLQNKVL